MSVLPTRNVGSAPVPHVAVESPAVPGVRTGARAARRHPLVRSSALVLAALLSCALLPSSADAQFGKLLKKAQQKAMGKSDAAPGSGSVPAPTFSRSVLEITDVRLGQLLKGLDAERAAKPRLQQDDAAAQAAYEASLSEYQEKKAAYERDDAAYQRKREAYESCSEKVEAKYDQEAANDSSAEEREQAKDALDAELEARAQRMQGMAERMQAAQARGDQKTMHALADSLHNLSSMTVAVGRAQQDQFRKSNERDQKKTAELAACGDPGKAPVAPEPPGQMSPRLSGALNEAGAQASGLTTVQYSVMRERVAAYVNVQGKFASGNQYAFSEVELHVLHEHLRELTDRGADLAPYGAWKFAPKRR
jgi:hypothetical protein